MKIQQSSHSLHHAIAPSATTVATEDTLQGIVKEVMNEKEVLMQVKGREVPVWLDQPVRKNDHIKIKVTHIKEGYIEGQVLSKTPTEFFEEPVTRPNMAAPSEQVQKAAQRLRNAGYRITESSIVALERFFTIINRSASQTDETISALVNKELEVTVTHLTAIDEALHGDGLKELFKEAVTNRPNLSLELQVKVEEALKSVKGATQSSFNQEEISVLLQRLKTGDNVESILQQLKKVEEIPKNIVEQLQRIFRTSQEVTASILKELNRDDLLKNMPLTKQEMQALLLELKSSGVSQEVQRKLLEGLKLQELVLQRTIDLVTALQTKQVDIKNVQEVLHLAMRKFSREPNIKVALEHLSNQVLPVLIAHPEHAEKVSEALVEASKLADQHKEMAARKQINEVILAISESSEQSSAKDLPFHAATKDVVVTVVTEKLAHITKEFKNIQQQVNRQLLNVSDLLQESAPSARMKASQLLEATVKQLDKAILQSDFMLYADMKSEKEMLKASQLLQEAKRLLAQGDRSQAHSLVMQIKEMIKGMDYKPSHQKMLHFVQDDLFSKAALPGISIVDESEIGARDIYETVKRLGFQREKEALHVLQGQQQASTADVKSGLLKGEYVGVSAQTTDSALQHITGQQLLNKQDSSSAQQLYMQIPFTLKGEIGTMKVFVQSNKQHEKIDWENTSLYFLFETKQLGEIGVMLKAADRNLSISFETNSDVFVSNADTVVDELKDKITAIGYAITGVSYSELRKGSEEEVKAPIKKQIPLLSMKGFDYSI
ncbi:hypothetical protein NIZ91_20305 [Bacillus sp. 1780r2a1]|nr:hypothetical protein NIZ91_20305 [Bacillus sp. 1780r2a1]